MKGNTAWTIWLKAQLKRKGWGVTRLARECKPQINPNTIYRQIHEGRTPTPTVRAVIEEALGSESPR